MLRFSKLLLTCCKRTEPNQDRRRTSGVSDLLFDVKLLKVAHYLRLTRCTSLHSVALTRLVYKQLDFPPRWPVNRYKEARPMSEETGSSGVKPESVGDGANGRPLIATAGDLVKRVQIDNPRWPCHPLPLDHNLTHTTKVEIRLDVRLPHLPLCPLSQQRLTPSSHSEFSNHSRLLLRKWK
jgi:hypothetical protein